MLPDVNNVITPTLSNSKVGYGTTSSSSDVFTDENEEDYHNNGENYSDDQVE